MWLARHQAGPLTVLWWCRWRHSAVYKTLPMCQALGNFFMQFISFNSYNYPAKSMFCALTIGGKMYCIYAFTHSSRNYFLGAMHHTLKICSLTSWGRHAPIKKRSSAIQKIIIAWAKCLEDTADWVVREGGYSTGQPQGLCTYFALCLRCSCF